MARGLFSRFKAEVMRQTLDENLAGTTLMKAYAFDAGPHTVDFDLDEFVSDITAGALETSAITMTNVTVSDDGEVDFDPYTITGFAGDTVEAVLYTLTHTALADELLVYYDDNVDFTPDGDDRIISYTTYVFKL